MNTWHQMIEYNIYRQMTKYKYSYTQSSTAEYFAIFGRIFIPHLTVFGQMLCGWHSHATSPRKLEKGHPAWHLLEQSKDSI